MTQDRRRVAVTGVGAVTPMGVGSEKLWEGVSAGRSTARRITLFDPADLPVDFACEVPGCDEPVGGAEVTITAPWPKDLTVAVKYLRRYAAA